MILLIILLTTTAEAQTTVTFVRDFVDSTQSTSDVDHVRVTYVYDGDTFETSDKVIRLARIDCPEKSTVEGMKITHEVRMLLKDEKVWIEPTGKGYYGRTIAEVFIDLPDQYLKSMNIDESLDSLNLSTYLLNNGCEQFGN